MIVESLDMTFTLCFTFCLFSSCVDNTFYLIRIVCDFQNHFPTTERSRYSDPSFYHQYQYDNMSFQKDKQDMGRSIGRRYMEPLKGESLDEPDNQHIKRSSNSRNSSHEDRSSKKSSWSDDSGHSNSTVHLTQTNMASSSNGHNGKSYNWKEMPADAVLKIERPHFRLPHKSSLLKKLSDSSYVVPDEHQQPPQQPPQQQQQQQQQLQYQQQPPQHHQHATAQYTGDELRGQLPWSYFGARSDVVKPKKSFVELRDDEDLPPVPVPDYTMKFSQKDRPLNTGERRAVPAKKFINPKKGSARDREQSRK